MEKKGPLAPCVLYVLLVLTLSSCATSYKPLGMFGGYVDERMEEGIYRVVFVGNRYTSSRQVADFALLRAAELVAQNGYTYFIILNDESELAAALHARPLNKPTRNPVFGGSFYVQAFKSRPENVPTKIYEARAVGSDIRKQYDLPEKQ